MELTVTPLPGAEEGRAAMFAELEASAWVATRAFIGLAPGNGKQQALGIARSPAWIRRGLSVLDHNADGQVTISNLVIAPWYGRDDGALRVGQEFQARVVSIMAPTPEASCAGIREAGSGSRKTGVSARSPTGVRW